MVNTIISTINNPDTVSVRIVELDGKSVVKNISFNDYLKMLTGYSVSTNERKRFNIPPETYDISYGADDDYSVVFIIDPQIALVKYMKDKYSIPFPKMCFYVSVKNNAAVSTRVFALKTGSVCDTTPLYHYPFGNVYANGAICWGSNSLPPVNSVRDALLLFSLFMSAETNSDLWCDEWCHIENVPPILSGVYGYLNNKTVFPESALVRIDEGAGICTIKDLFNVNV